MKVGLPADVGPRWQEKRRRQIKAALSALFKGDENTFKTM